MSVNSADGPPHNLVEIDRILSLTPNEIHLWLVSYDEIDDERLHSAYRELLNAAEQEQEQRFYFTRTGVNSDYPGIRADGVVTLCVHPPHGVDVFRKCLWTSRDSQCASAGRRSSF
jgi:hypothetical protein